MPGFTKAISHIPYPISHILYPTHADPRLRLLPERPHSWQLLESFGHLDYSLLLLLLDPADHPADSNPVRDDEGDGAQQGRHSQAAAAEHAPAALMQWTVRAIAELPDGSCQHVRFRASIIDYLAPFNNKKRAALVVKRSCFRPDLALKAIDTAPPRKYAVRFAGMARRWIRERESSRSGSSPFAAPLGRRGGGSAPQRGA
jgi:hypothetical protein